MADYFATFLGTGTSQGIPVIGCECVVCQSINSKDNRLRTSILISLKNKNIVVDTGPDFRQQMLSNQVKMVHAVLFTHEHKDHLAGLDDIRAYNFKSKKDMDVYATERVQEALKREFSYVFSGISYPGLPKIELKLITDEVIEIFDETIVPINVMHYKLPVKGFRVRGLTYITDANFISDVEKKKIVGTDILVLNT